MSLLALIEGVAGHIFYKFYLSFILFFQHPLKDYGYMVSCFASGMSCCWMASVDLSRLIQFQLMQFVRTIAFLGWNMLFVALGYY